jgi:predicted metal-dependent hydrolase
MSFMAPIGAPEQVAIKPRDRRFSRTPLAERWWLGGDAVATAFYNAMSASFPHGEAFFIETLRHFRDKVEPALAAEIEAFIKQELVHAREHLALNRRVTDTGYDVAPLETRVETRLKLLRTKGPIVALAATIALEHLTAVFAHEVLADRRHMAGADPELAQLWRWHCIEEVEHKGVAFDAWRHITRDWTPWRRWLVRSKVMILVSRRFFYDRWCGTMELLRQDGITGPKARMAAIWFGLARPGMVLRMIQGGCGFFKPGFHPWDHDNRHLIPDSVPAHTPTA